MLSRSEREAFLTLIYHHSHGGLDARQEAELRRLVAQDFPTEAEQLDREGLISLACGILGAADFIKALEAAEARAEA